MDSLSYVNAFSKGAFSIQRDGDLVLQAGLIRLTGSVDPKLASLILSEADDGEHAFRMIKKLCKEKPELVRFHKTAASKLSTQINPKTVDDKSRSVEIILATEDAIEAFDLQTFEFVTESVLLSGMKFGEQVPLLDSHQRNSIAHIVGSIRNLHISGGALLGLAVFGDGDFSKRSFQDVKNGHLTDLSVGANRVESIFIQSGSTKTFGTTTFAGPLKVVTQSLLVEGSLVVRGADPSTKVV